jgi:clan AA aspartic protease
MGQVYADFKLVNVFTKQSVSIHAVVDTGATDAFVTWEVARQLGFDPEEASVEYVTTADGRRVPTPRLGPVSIHFDGRQCSSDIRVLPGSTCLIGAIPLEQLRLIVDRFQQKVIRDPDPPWQYVIPVRVID